MKRIVNDQLLPLRAPEGPLAVYGGLFSKWASGQDAARLRCGSGFGSATELPQRSVVSGKLCRVIGRAATRRVRNLRPIQAMPPTLPDIVRKET